MKKVLCFDVGYTLVNEDIAWRQRCEEQAKTEEARRLGLSAEDIFHEIEKASAAKLPQYRAVAEKFQFQEVVPYRPETEFLYDGVLETLQTLSEKYSLVVIANQSVRLFDRLHAFGIFPLFTEIVASAAVGLQKPDPRIFEYALDLVRCEPADAVMIGDRLDNDIEPAKALGMETVWIRQGFGRCQTPSTEADTPDHTIDCITELLNFY